MEKIFNKVLKKDFQDNAFFESLLNLYKCPEILYYSGVLPIKNKNTKVISIIGSRKMTSYGKDVINKIIFGLAEYDIIIISGLALGCDSEAHKQAIKNNIITIALPGSGIDESVIYPQSNIKLAREIIDNGGAIISEFDPKEKAALWTFPARNRIIAGLSDFVLIVEAEAKSGTQITARLALEYGKDIGIVPGSIFSIYSVGTVGLWKDGAYPITCAEDILEILKINKSPEQRDLFENNLNADKSILKNNKSFDNKEIDNENVFFNKNTFSENEKTILKYLDAPIYKDELIDKCLEEGLSFDIVLTTLITLESKGIIKDNFDEIKRIK